MLVLRVCLQQINATYYQIEYQWTFWLCSIPRRFRFGMFPVAVKCLQRGAGPANREHKFAQASVRGRSALCNETTSDRCLRVS